MVKVDSYAYLKCELNQN